MALLVVLFGAFVTVVGGAGTIEISGLGMVIKADTGGMALIAFALIFYLAIGKLINDLHG